MYATARLPAPGPDASERLGHQGSKVTARQRVMASQGDVARRRLLRPEHTCTADSLFRG